MKTIKHAIIILLLICCTSMIFAQSNEDNLIQMAILLDTSNSMDGLIDQAKSQLWKIVNELALTKKGGKSPILEVALFEYGKSSIPAAKNHLAMILPLTRDLDEISEKLFNLTTNGGDEYCGAVIDSAIKQLKWTKRNDILKVIFIAGNEPFDQGGVSYKKSCKKAISKGVIVNTIFCGDIQEGIDTYWKHGADLADGSYINIDQNQVVEYIEAPQDKEIIALNERLNSTYVSYGSEGDDKKMKQERQDSNALGFNKESAIQRTITKSTGQYNNAAWDIVDAVESEEVTVEEMKDSELPEEMKGMSKEERIVYVEKLAKEREEIQTKIRELNDERNKYIEKVRKEKAEESSLDDAIINVIIEQAKEKNFK